MNKKGQVGMDVTKAVFLMFLLISIIAIVTIVTLSLLRDTTGATTTWNGATTNETGAWVNGTIYTVDEAGLPGFGGFTVNSVRNTTDNGVINAGNYTVGTSGTLVNATAVQFNTVYINYDFTFTNSSDAALIAEDVSSGYTNFFEESTTIFSIIIVMIIILAIAIIVVAVSKFGSRRTGL